MSTEPDSQPEFQSNTQPTSKRHATAIRHVERGRTIVAQQRQLIAHAEELLKVYERSLSHFEDDLKEIEQQEAS